MTAAAVVSACSAGAGPDEAVASTADELTYGQTVETLRGAVLFFAPFPGTNGNGRACGTCHNLEDHLGLSPATVEARYQLLQERKARNENADDPLFRPIDADDGVSDYTTLRQHALVRVTIALPDNPNIWLADAPDQKTVSLLRSVPSALNVAYTAPYQWDGRFATLQQQALGALHQHAEIANEPSSRMLDDVSAFESVLFSSANAKKQVDPPLNAVEQQGQATFTRACAICHGGPSQTVVQPAFAKLQNIFTSRPLPPFTAGIAGFANAPPLPQLRWAVRGPTGVVAVRVSTDPGRALITNNPADFNAFDVPQLRGLAYTAPYFHDNSAATIEDVVNHYLAFFAALTRVGAQPPPPALAAEEVPALVAYLKKL